MPMENENLVDGTGLLELDVEVDVLAGRRRIVLHVSTICWKEESKASYAISEGLVVCERRMRVLCVYREIRRADAWLGGPSPSSSNSWRASSNEDISARNLACWRARSLTEGSF